MPLFSKLDPGRGARKFAGDADADGNGSIASEAIEPLPSASASQGDDLLRRIDALLKIPFLRLRLPPDLQARYVADTRVTVRRVTFPWFLWVAAAVMVAGIFDVLLLPGEAVTGILVSRTLLAAGYVVGAWLVRKGRLTGREHLAAIVPCLSTILLAGGVGIISGDATLMERYLDEAMMASYSAVIFADLGLEYCIWLAILAVSLMTAFVAASAIAPLAAKIQSVVFAASVMAGLIQGRHVQNLFLVRLYLLNTRDRLRNSEISRRNERLSSMAYTDTLTGVPNRRYLDEISAGLCEDGEKPLPLSLCLIDIDNFKKLNDTLGHGEGDRCLRLVAATIRENLRGQADILARYGGEEFALLLPSTGLAQAMEVADRVRAAVAALGYANPGTAEGRVTVSVGVAVRESLPLAIEELCNAADSAMYRAKAAGRNRVSL